MEDRKPSAMPAEVSDDGDSRSFADLIAAPVGDTAQADGLVVGRLVGFADDGLTPLVTYPGQCGVAPVPARATLDLRAPHIGRDTVLMFEGGDRERPIVIGCLRSPGAQLLSQSQSSPGVEVEADGERLTVTAQHGLVLRCGKASITLSPDGKVVLRGTQVVSHASGLNRIRGGSVQLN